MSSENHQMTLQEKWGTKFNSVTVKKSLQSRLKKQFKKNAVEKERSGNKGE